MCAIDSSAPLRSYTSCHVTDSPLLPSVSVTKLLPIFESDALLGDVATRRLPLAAGSVLCGVLLPFFPQWRSLLHSAAGGKGSDGK